VNIVATAYAWNNINIAYFGSTIGNTCPAKDPYYFTVSNEWNVRKVWQHPRPALCDFIFRMLPTVYGFNKSDKIALRRRKSCWTKLFNSFIRMSIVNHHRITNYKFPN
jgi:hypothetical protein